MSDTPISTPHAAPAESASPMQAPRKAGWAFMLQNPLHWIAMGFGSGLSPKAPGTVGTLWAWVAYLVLQLWLTPQAIGILIAVSIPLGWWACTATARNMGIADPGSIVWDEVVAFWIILWLVMPVGFWGQLISSLLPKEEELADGGFGDIEALAGQCRFRDCAHQKEPGCAVRAAVEAGTLDAGRLANYLKLRDEVAGAADRLATRLAQKSDARVQGKALNKRLDEKYGKH